MKRIVLFILTNLAVMIVLSIVVRVFGLDQALEANGLNLGALLVYSAVVGFTGAIISLLMSKSIAKWSTGAQVIDSPRDESQAWLLAAVKRLADKAGISMPEVAVYEGEPNAFATGAFRNSALVAVSSGLLSSMSREELEAVLGHEIAHVANGDMVTMTLIQGVLNTFVVFLPAWSRSSSTRSSFAPNAAPAPDISSPSLSVRSYSACWRRSSLPGFPAVASSVPTRAAPNTLAARSR
jgi:heat shock protein HtpX